MIRVLAGAMACLALGQSVAMAAPMTSDKKAVVSALSNRLLETIRLAPAGSDASAYEQQLVAVITQAAVECPIAVAAAQEAQSGAAPLPAHRALAVVIRLASRCGYSSTGAVGGAGGLALASGPALGGGGGGADYH